VSAVVFLESGPLGLLSNPNNSPQPVACRQWVARLQAANRRIIIPEITDYEVRRELLRVNKTLSITLLDLLAQQLDYLPLTTAAMRAQRNCGRRHAGRASRLPETTPSTPT
jgi:hypothetical protein